MSRAVVFKWHRRFAGCQHSLEEQEGGGREEQYGATTATTVTSVREALAADRRLTIRELVEQFDMSYGTMHRVLTEDLHEPCCKKVSDHSYNIVNANY